MNHFTAPSKLQRRVSVVLGVWALVLMTACTGCSLFEIRDGGPDPEDAGIADDCFANSAGDCVVTTAGCEPGDISGGADERCASCSEDGERFEICGAPTVGACFQVEDPEPCTRCFADDGATVYSDCGDVGAAAVLDCEETFYEPSPGAPDGELCQVCRDGTGRVVSETCGAEQPDECHEEIVDGRACEVCTLDGQEVSFFCETAPLSDAPRVCESYASADGSCVDCYGDDDQLLLHECTFGDGAGDVAFCETITEPSGLVCERCLNDDGFVVSEQCEGPWMGPERCQDLFYEFESEVIGCFVCVDEENTFTVADCWSSLCEDTDPGGMGGNDAACAPPSCSNSYENGEACRTCTSEAGETNTQCVVAGDIYCQEEEVFVDAPQEDPNQPPPVEVQVCTVCRDAQTGEEVYRDETCGSDVVGVACEPAFGVDGTPCEICFDDFTQEPVYSTCGDDSMCGVQADIPLLDGDGAQLSLPASPDTNEPAVPAVVDCSFCESALDIVPPEDGGYCLLQRPACADGTEPCAIEPNYLVAYDLTQCADPWGSSDGYDGMANAMAWVLSTHEVVTNSVTHTLPTMQPETCEACDCTRGDRFVFEASYDDMQRLLALNIGFYEDGDVTVMPEPPPPPQP